jgi:hypothetical protein
MHRVDIITPVSQPSGMLQFAKPQLDTRKNVSDCTVPRKNSLDIRLLS